MANKVYGISINYAKKEVATKEELEDKLKTKSNTNHTHDYNALTNKPSTFPPSTHNHDERYKKKEDYAIIDGKITLNNGAGTVQLQYPSGFTKTNSVILTIAKEFANNSGNWDYISQQGAMLFGARLLDSSINVTISSVGGAGASNTYGIRVVLMKV